MINLKQLFCWHNYQFVKEKMLDNDALIRCNKCEKEKRISFDKARDKGFITKKQHGEIMESPHN